MTPREVLRFSKGNNYHKFKQALSEVAFKGIWQPGKAYQP
jgi:hypothetical protein